jgi:transcriptional regulator with XRE-family HTH domain
MELMEKLLITGLILYIEVIAMFRGDRVEELRKKKGWTQQELADRIGKPRSTVSNYIKGRRPPAETLSLLASVLGTSTDYLLGITDDPDPISEIKKDMESSHPDLLDIIKRTKPHIGGVPIDEETAEILYYQMKALKEKLLRDVQKKNQIKRASACGN